MNTLPASSLVLGLAWFIVVNALASAASWAIGSVVLSSPRRDRMGVLLAIRLLPAAASLLFVWTMFLPGHWRLEPIDARESFGFVLGGLALAGGMLLLRGASRAVSAARAARRLRACQRLTHRDTALPSGGLYEVKGLPGVSLAGVLRPRILVGDGVARRLSAAELDVAVAHELAHRGALDNLKRFAMFCAPDLFGATRVARSLEGEWRAAAETLADARAVNGDACRAVHLASALVKVAKLATASPSALTSPVWSTLNDPPLLEMRVRRLVGGAAPAVPRRAPGRAPAIAAALFVGMMISGAALAQTVHHFTEALVRWLP
jgi:hypothetical protein